MEISDGNRGIQGCGEKKWRKEKWRAILFKIRQKTGQKERRLFDTINVRSFFPWRDKTMDKEGE